MRLRRIEAVLSGNLGFLGEAPGVVSCGPAQGGQQRAPAAVYAVQAAKQLEVETSRPALVSLAGPVGSCLEVFEKARGPEGGLMEPGYAKRSRRVHPFTLLVSLQNQTAAALSVDLGWTGPCWSLTEPVGAFVDLLPILDDFRGPRPLVVVLSSATGRWDDLDWVRSRHGGGPILEGAIALLFDDDGSVGGSVGDSVGEIEPDVAVAVDAEPLSVGPDLDDDWPIAPGLEPGLAILWALGHGLREARFGIGAPGRDTSFAWKAA